ncbi:hypothetical protein Leryth_015023, partial [Lithospermum erythrorhizon]
MNCQHGQILKAPELILILLHNLLTSRRGGSLRHHQQMMKITILLGYHHTTPTAPHAEGAYTFPSSASRFTGFQKRFFSHSTLSENETKMNVPETKRPSFGRKGHM